MTVLFPGVPELEDGAEPEKFLNLFRVLVTNLKVLEQGLVNCLGKFKSVHLDSVHGASKTPKHDRRDRNMI